MVDQTDVEIFKLVIERRLISSGLYSERDDFGWGPINPDGSIERIKKDKDEVIYLPKFIQRTIKAIGDRSMKSVIPDKGTCQCGEEAVGSIVEDGVVVGGPYCGGCLANNMYLTSKEVEILTSVTTTPVQKIDLVPALKAELNWRR